MYNLNYNIIIAFTYAVVIVIYYAKQLTFKKNGNDIL